MDSYLTLSHLRDHEISLELLYDAWIGQKLDLKLTQNSEATRDNFYFITSTLHTSTLLTSTLPWELFQPVDWLW